MRVAALFLTALTLAACGGGLDAEDELAADDGYAIQGGSKDTGHPAVGLVWISGGGFCTGTLIKPQVVLTAAHCVTDKVLSFYTGNGAATTGVNVPTSMVAHAVDKQAKFTGYNGGTCPNATGDVGLIHLAKPITTITPIPLASKAPAAKASCTAVGFGTHNSGTTEQYEEKRKATGTVSAIAAGHLTVTQGSGIADHGDSGGPLICGSSIAGATSCHTDGDYPQHKVEYYARVDAFRTWLDATIKGWGN